jgi:hypothetical protein
VSVSESTTRLVRKVAPTVDVICAGLKAPLQYRMTSDVFPTPWAPRTTILASREDIFLVVEVVGGGEEGAGAFWRGRRSHGLGGWRMDGIDRRTSTKVRRAVCSSTAVSVARGQTALLSSRRATVAEEGGR